MYIVTASSAVSSSPGFPHLGLLLASSSTFTSYRRRMFSFVVGCRTMNQSMS